MPRKKKAPVTATPEPPKPPTCAQCGVELTWRDAVYGAPAREATDEAPATGPTCKRCHARAQKQALRGVYHPLVRTVLQQGQQGAGQTDAKPVQAIVLANRVQQRQDARRPAPLASPPRPRYLNGVRFATREPVASGEQEVQEDQAEASA